MIQIRNLKKSYGSVEALKGLNMEIGSGELFGFVGPNGAGKTTTMKIAAGLLAADSGEILIAGERLMRKNRKLKEKIGYVPDFFGVYDNLTVQEYMEFYASLYGMDGRAARERSTNLLKMLHLEEYAQDMVDILSRGIKQRLCMARALVHDPELLILDEPASGMEPMARAELRELLCELCAEGRTILVSSHQLEDLAQMCTSIGIIREGKLVVQGRTEELLQKQRRLNPYHLRYRVFPEEALECLKRHPLVKNLVKTEKELSFGFGGRDEETAGLMTELIQAGAEIYSFYREEGRLEEILSEALKGEKRR